MNIDFRKADLTNEKDGQHITSLLNGFLNDVTLPHEITKTVSNGLIESLREFPTTLIFFAEADGEPVGIAVCFIGFSTFYNRKLLNIHDLFIYPEYQGQKIGGRLMDFVEEQARKMGCCKVTLEVYNRNERACSLYEKRGYAGGKNESVPDIMYFLQKTLD